MGNFTLHIFGYGETQYIKEDVNFKTATADLTKVQPLLDAIWAERPEGTVGGDDYHTVSLFDYNRKNWTGKKDEASFKINGEDTLVVLIDELIVEITAVILQE